MTDEYREYLKSKDTRGSDHQGVPKWKPSNNNAPLSHSGVKGMKWGVINERKDKQYDKSIGDTLNDTVGKVFGAEESEHSKETTAGDLKATALLTNVKSNKDAPDKVRKEHSMELLNTINDTVYNNNVPGKEPSVRERATAITLLNSLADGYEKTYGSLKTSESYLKVAEQSQALSKRPDDEFARRGYDMLVDGFCQKILEESDMMVDKDTLKVMRDILITMEVLPRDGSENMFEKQLKDVSSKDLAAARENQEKKKTQATEETKKAQAEADKAKAEAEKAQAQAEAAIKEAEKKKQEADELLKKIGGVAHSSIQKPSWHGGDTLTHYGIPKMEWHKRRFQYPDGSLTPLGRIRYGVGQPDDNKKSSESSESKKESSSKGDGDTTSKKSSFNSKTLTYKAKAQTLTDDELDRRNKRMQKEVQYNQLRSQLQLKSKKERRKEIRHQIFVATATTAAAAIMTAAYKKAAVWMIKKATNGKIDLGGGKKKS